MKRQLKITLALTLVAIIVFACKELDIVRQMAIKTIEVSNITHERAYVKGDIIDIGEGITDYGAYYHTEPNAQNGIKVSQGNAEGTGEFTVIIESLTPGTQYYTKAYASDGATFAYGSEITFTTEKGLPVLTTNTVSNITPTTANCGGNTTDDGGFSISARGVCWSTSTSPTIKDFKTTDGIGTGSWQSNISGLTAGTTYYVRAYASNNVGTEYGNEHSFITLDGIPELTTNTVIDITNTTATCGGTIASDGGSTITARGVCWSTSTSPTIIDQKTNDGSDIGSFTSSLTGLLAGTTFYARAYAINSIDTVYGNEQSFTTLDGTPELTTNIVTAITITTATCGGVITDDGGSGIIARGVCWSTSTSPTIADDKTTDGDDVGSFTSSITDLIANTTYYVRAYATRNVGTDYGNEQSFTTLSGLPELTTSEVDDISTTSATCGGTITDNGGATVTARGVCWSTSQNPDILGNKTTDGNGTGNYISQLTSLSPNTTHYVRAYATNANGTVYGNERSFTTLITVPSAKTEGITNRTATTASCDGNIMSNGGSTVTSRGICWSTSNNPTIADNKTDEGTGTGSFSSILKDLLPSTTYYFRAYAINIAGIGYGSVMDFSTLDGLPKLTTSEVANITSTSATFGGSVTDNGGSAITARGVCWSKSTNPNTDDNKTTEGTGVGVFTSAVTGLTPNTTYYVRTYATNANGTAYGSEESFTTLTELPSLTTNSVIDITISTASCGGEITSDGGATVTARGVCWSTSSNPTISNSKTNNGTGSGNFTSSITNLTLNTTYYVRAYATNAKGTAYGNEQSFASRNGIIVLTTNSISNVYSTSATSGGTISDNGGATVTARGVCWNTSGTPTTANSRTSNGTGTGNFTSNITSLTNQTKYYVRAYATNSVGTVYGGQVSFTTLESTGTLTDVNGNVYNWVKIGTQYWMAENLKATKYADGTSITRVSTNYQWYNLLDNDTYKAYCFYNNDEGLGFGALYTYAAATNGDNSGIKVQGVCPTGWHLPNNTEWAELQVYLADNGYNYDGSTGGSGDKIAKALASTKGWTSSKITGDVGNNTTLNNASGFSGLPGGMRKATDGLFINMTNNMYMWSSTEYSSTISYDATISYNSCEATPAITQKSSGLSVRCIKN